MLASTGCTERVLSPLWRAVVVDMPPEPSPCFAMLVSNYLIC